MKIKRSETPDGKIELQITASADKVKEAIRFVDFQLAMESDIAIQSPENLTAAVREKVGDAFYDSFIGVQVTRFLAPFAITAEKLAIIGAPQVTSTNVTVTPGEGLSFTVVAILRPSYEIEDFSPVSIRVPRVTISDAEIDQQLVMIAENNTSFERDDDRPVQNGDTLLLAVKATNEAGEELKPITTEHRPYAVGRGMLPASFDEHIDGMNVGETRVFDLSSQDFDRNSPAKANNSDSPDNPDNPDSPDSPDNPEAEKAEDFSFTVTVLEQRKRVIPAITDAWVAKNIPDISTVPELREEIRRQGIAHRERELMPMKSFLAATELAKRFKGSIPDELYELTRDEIAQSLQQTFAAQGKSIQEFIREQGGEQQFSMQLMMQAREMLRQNLSLDALVRHLELEVTDEDINETFRLMAPGHEREAHMEFELTGRMYQIHEAALRNKATAWLVENAEIEYVD
jgi:trigger factor